MDKLKKFLPFLLWIFILLAVALRVAIFLQQRDLFIDEANVARNIYERSYFELVQVLDYEQFAPPIFLISTKFFAESFGYNEISLRLFPFLCSITSTFLLVYFIHLIVDKKYAIYPLALFAGGYIFLHFSSELKQYSSDFMVTLVLLIAAFKSSTWEVDLKFVSFWAILGSLAIWLSMPAVFFHGASPAFIFYTEMHDNKADFKGIKQNSSLMGVGW